ncbi:hypothetical protein [Spelaeicoccus albus]|uniref:Uncharacterized protein n=1 Tax=Spelaeicoccus albus TaxID=1280376 RepID=A0A7Z0A9K7_9MICO|nr:hypothetical protein [Spelaeicoccus albus]NYI66108.1 hypothetical protein [Spelaeicoccus albus]
MAWWRRKPDKANRDVRVGIRSSRTPVDESTTQVTVTRVKDVGGRYFPHLAGVVLRAVPTLPPPTGWEYASSRRYSAGDGAELLYRMPMLVCPVHNLSRGESRDYTVPAAAGTIAGLLLGSLTTKAWIDDGRKVTWLNDHDNQPGLFDFAERFHSDPDVRIYDVDTAGSRIKIKHRRTVRLSHLDEHAAD